MVGTSMVWAKVFRKVNRPGTGPVTTELEYAAQTHHIIIISHLDHCVCVLQLPTAWSFNMHQLVFKQHVTPFLVSHHWLSIFKAQMLTSSCHWNSTQLHRGTYLNVHPISSSLQIFILFSSHTWFLHDLLPPWRSILRLLEHMIWPHCIFCNIWFLYSFFLFFAIYYSSWHCTEVSLLYYYCL